MSRLLVFILLMTVPLGARSDGFGWYANTVNEAFFQSLLSGGLDAEYNALESHAAAMVEDDLADKNFPFLVADIRYSLQTLARTGISFLPMSDTDHDHQWYVLDSVLAPPRFFDRQYARAEIQPLGDDPVSPYALQQVLDRSGLDSTRLRVFTTGEVLGPRHEGGRCLPQQEFGYCIYRYIFLNRGEVEEIQAELATAWQDRDDSSIDALRQIFAEAVSRQRPLVFYGQD